MGRAGWSRLLKEGAGPLGPRCCAPAEAMAGGVARSRRLPAKRMVFEWPSWWVGGPWGGVVAVVGPITMLSPGDDAPLEKLWREARESAEALDAAGFLPFEWPLRAEPCELCVREEPCPCGPSGCWCSCGRCGFPRRLPDDGPDRG